MSNRALITEEMAFVDTEFGEMIARKWFGDDAVDALPTYVRGKRKGKKKGVVTWRKIRRGGWVNTGVDGDGYHGYVETRKGACIDQALCELYSNENGRGAGKVLVYGTLKDRQEREESRKVAQADTLKKDLEEKKEKFETKMKQVRKAKQEVKDNPDDDVWSDILDDLLVKKNQLQSEIWKLEEQLNNMENA